jgi:hypothetical protein
MPGALIRSKVEEFFGYQYKTQVIGYSGLTWWPEAATGYSNSREAAEQEALASDYDEVRVVKIVRSMEFFDPITKEAATPGMPDHCNSLGRHT